MSETTRTAGAEQITWYRDGFEAPYRISIAFPRDASTVSLGSDIGMIELFGTPEAPYGRMPITVDQLDDLAQHLALIVSEWRAMMEGQTDEGVRSEDDIPLGGILVMPPELESLLMTMLGYDSED